MATEPSAGPSEMKREGNAPIKARVRRIALIIVPLALLFVLFAQWMDARERRAQLHELRTRIDNLQAEINKARARVDNGGNANRSAPSR